VAGSCEEGDELSSSIKCREFLTGTVTVNFSLGLCPMELS
jgi:hypothetical protein